MTRILLPFERSQTMKFTQQHKLIGLAFHLTCSYINYCRNSSVQVHHLQFTQEQAVTTPLKAINYTSLVENAVYTRLHTLGNVYMHIKFLCTMYYLYT